MGDLILNWMTFLGGGLGALIGFLFIVFIGFVLAVPYIMMTRRDQLDPNPKSRTDNGREGRIIP